MKNLHKKSPSILFEKIEGLHPAFLALSIFNDCSLYHRREMAIYQGRSSDSRFNLISAPFHLVVCQVFTRSHLKKRVLAQVQGGPELQPAGILKYSEELKQGTNTEIGSKNFFEIASNQKDQPSGPPCLTSKTATVELFQAFHPYR